MKIGFVLDDSLDKTDGVQQYILTLGQWLRTQGHEVHYLVGHTERDDLIHVHSLSRNMQVHFNQNRMSTPLPASKQKIYDLLNDQQFDVLHVQMPYSPLMAGRVVRQANRETAVIGTFHIIPFSWLEKFAAKLLGLYQHQNIKRFDTILSVSMPAKKFAKQSYGVSSHLLPNVVDMHQFENGQKIAKYDDGKLNIVFLGRLVERKGCMHLLKALNVLRDKKQLDRVRVLICGKGPLSEELKTYVKENHLGGVVRFVGFVPEDKKADYFATADIAVLPSTGGESFGIVLIEAMAAGAKVVLGGDNVGYRFVLGDRPEQLIDPNNTEAFAKTLRHYIVSSKAREQARKWQINHVKQFDVKVVGKKLVEYYESAIAKRSSSQDNVNK